MQVVLTVIEGPHKGREFAFTGHDTFLVGRSKRTHFQLLSKDRYFSRIHFLVEVNPPRCRLVDMNSRNGTFVNDERVQSRELRHGDRIKAGHTILQVNVPEDEPAADQGPDTLSWEDLVEAPPASQPTETTTATLPEIPGYHVLRELGRGGMGVVYLARDEREGVRVALKTITPAVAPSRAMVERFLREATILRHLRHPRIVSFHDMGEAGGLLYFAMDYVAGTDASRLVKKHGPLPVKSAIVATCQLLEALEYAHEQGFVHRDIKPANLLLKSDERRMMNDERKKERRSSFIIHQSSFEGVKLADFGLARVYQTSQLSGLTLSGEFGGTMQFMPPEQITHYRQARPAGDQFATAATLYYLLTGQFVYDFKDSRKMPMLLILEEDPVPIEKRGVKLPAGLAEVIGQALAREPAERFADVAEFREALAEFV